MNNNSSFSSEFENRLRGIFKKNRIAFLASLITGFAAHFFALTNKLPNHDDVESLFGKGATITSGRWGLELIKPIFPDYSMPWLYGLISILLFSVAVCIIIKCLDIRDRRFQAVVGALILGFPSLTGTFCFMFTSSAYALAFLLSVLAVSMFERGSWRSILGGIVMLVFSLSIYQAYIAITSSLFVLIMIKRSLKAEDSVKSIVIFGIKAVIYMGVALAFYFAVTVGVFVVTGAEFNDYVVENVNDKLSFIGKIRMAYDAFIYVFQFRNFYLVPTEFSRCLHIVYAVVLFAAGSIAAFRSKSPVHIALTALLVAILPLSMNCMFLAMSGKSIHTLVLYSFVCIYLLAAVVEEALDGRAKKYFGSWLLGFLCVFAVTNIYFANMCYLKLNLQYENAKSFYTGLITRIEQCEGFDENCDIAIIGRQDNLLYSPPQLDTELLMGPPKEMINIYSRENFFRYYMGVDLPFAEEAEFSEIMHTSEFAKMAEYPYYGSVQKIDNHIVVKLG